MNRDVNNKLDAFCIGVIDGLRDQAKSQMSLASGFIHSITFNRHDHLSIAECNRRIDRAIESALRLNKLADEWEANGIPAGFHSMARQVNGDCSQHT